jgi:hypothetical protein
VSLGEFGLFGLFVNIADFVEIGIEDNHGYLDDI